jgi:hypothetical protein
MQDNQVKIRNRYQFRMCPDPFRTLQAGLIKSAGRRYFNRLFQLQMCFFDPGSNTISKKIDLNRLCILNLCGFANANLHRFSDAERLSLQTQTVEV